MALNVISNYAANVAHRYLQQSDEAATRSLAKLSAGTRVLGARDDAASLAIATSIRSDLGGLRQASVNAGQASSMLQIADGAMGTVTDILVRAKTLAVQAASDQLTNTQREMIGVEFVALQDEVDRISQSTRFDGQTLLAGAAAGGKSSKVTATVSENNKNNQYATLAYEFNEGTAVFNTGSYSVLANIGGSNLKLDVTGADSAAELAAAINADAVFKQYFVASSELVNNNTATARLYLTSLTDNALTSFSVVNTSDLSSSVTGLSATAEKVGEAIVYDFSETKLTSNDKLSFTLGGATYDVNLSDVKNWSSQVGNVAAASGTADNLVAAQSKKVAFDLTGFLSTTGDTLSVSISNSTGTSIAYTTDFNSSSHSSVADVIDAFVTAHNTNTSASANGGVTLTREGNQLILTGTAGTDFTVGSVSAETAGATAVEVGGNLLQENKKTAAVGFDADGNFVRKNTTTVQSANTSVQLSTKETLDFLAAYINDSSSAPHTLGASVIASVTANNELVLTARGGTHGQQAEFGAGTFFATTSSQAFEVTFQIGAKNAEYERLTVNIANVSTESLGVDKDTVKITTAQNALNAIDSLNAALDSMAQNRADIGAQQNRLDFASANLAATIENQEAARSNLMDLDVAAEMSYFTGQQILQQAGVSMLAQANQMPQNLMRLFR